jgi:hypothetical protein
MTTCNKSGQWTMQGGKDGGNNSGGDVIVLAVTRAGVGWCDESGRGEEGDAAMAADGYIQQSFESSNGNGRYNGDSNDDSNSAAVTATTINNKRQQRNGSGSHGNGGGSCNGGGDHGDSGGSGNGGNGGGNCGGSGSSHYSATGKGRVDRCSDHHCRVSAAPNTISATSAWTPWLKYWRLEGLF